MILVTGSSGHLGEALVRTLRAQGRAVRGLDRLPSPFTDCVGSITEHGLVAQALLGVRAVLHTATLHKPHVGTHPRQAFVDTNVGGTLNLIEQSIAAGVRRFVFTSTTSTFGRALTPPPGAPAAWIDESVRPVPKNIYGATKTAAEDLCELAHRAWGLPCVVLRTSRFFPELDDDEAARAGFADANLKLNELLHRRLDLEDCVDAHLAALDAPLPTELARYVISAPTPFEREDAAALALDAPAVLDRRVPGWRERYAQLGWQAPPRITRVYDSRRAMAELQWSPRHGFSAALERALSGGGEIRSELARAVGRKGYHAGARGIYPFVDMPADSAAGGLHPAAHPSPARPC